MIALAILGWAELFIILVTLTLVAFSTSFDKEGKDYVKWLWLTIGAAVYVGYQWAVQGSWPLSWSLFTNKEYWLNLAGYLSLGLVYCLVEVTVDVLETKRRARLAWSSFVSQADSNVAAYLEQSPDRDKSYDQYANAKVSRLCWEELGTKGSVLKFVLENGKPVPTVEKQVLAENCSAWIVLWPAYALSIVFGRILDYLCTQLVEWAQTALQRFTKFVFRNTFKV
jgi:hypothetical protein